MISAINAFVFREITLFSFDDGNIIAGWTFTFLCWVF